MTHRVIRTRGQRIAWTNTSGIPDDKIVAAIKFVAAEVDLNRTVVHVKKFGRGTSDGCAYGYIPSIANLDGLKRREWRYLITVRDYGGFLNTLHTLAHEAKHIEQYRERKLQRREQRSNAFAAWVTERWIEAH